MGEWQPIAAVNPDAPYIIGAFFTDDGNQYARPVIADLWHKDWPKRIEFYVEKQRVFPTHFLSFTALHVER